MGSRIIRREVRKRGFFGWIFFLIFWGFNALMLLWLIAALNLLSSGPSSIVVPGLQHDTAAQATRAGHAIGAGIGIGVIFFLWIGGAVITGLFALLTRGRKSYIEEFAD